MRELKFPLVDSRAVGFIEEAVLSSMPLLTDRELETNKNDKEKMKNYTTVHMEIKTLFGIVPDLQATANQFLSKLREAGAIRASMLHYMEGTNSADLPKSITSLHLFSVIEIRKSEETTTIPTPTTEAVIEASTDKKAN